MTPYERFAPTEATPRALVESLLVLFEDEQRWTQFVFARSTPDVDAGFANACSTTAPYAVCWCLSGAIQMLSDSDNDLLKRSFELINRYIVPTFNQNVSTFNDLAKDIETIRSALREILKGLPHE